MEEQTELWKLCVCRHCFYLLENSFQVITLDRKTRNVNWELV